MNIIYRKKETLSSDPKSRGCALFILSDQSGYEEKYLSEIIKYIKEKYPYMDVVGKSKFSIIPTHKGLYVPKVKHSVIFDNIRHRELKILEEHFSSLDDNWYQSY